MNRLKFITIGLVLAAMAATSSASPRPRGSGHYWHGGGHWHGHAGFFIGVPLGAALYPYYAPRVVTVTPPPVVYYVEQSPAMPASPLPPGWWYYCANPSGYYPYVQSCTQPWVPVEPQQSPPR